MILLWGVAEDPPLACVRHALEAAGAPYLLLDQRARVESYRFTYGTRLTAQIGPHDLADVASAYIRPLDYGSLHEHATPPDAANRILGLRRFAQHLTDWLELAPILVVNRFSAQASNTSKLYQQRRIQAQGFTTPDSLATSDVAAAREFHRRHGAVVYKSLSSVRSIVSRLDQQGLERLSNLRHCPTLFQQFIAGIDYRVHVVGDRAFTTMLSSAEADYRYDRAAERLRVDLPEEVRERCIRLSRSLGLAFSGIDLRRGVDGQCWCFEVNPSPAFPYFEQPGSAEIAEALAGELAAARRTTAAQVR